MPDITDMDFSSDGFTVAKIYFEVKRGYITYQSPSDKSSAARSIHIENILLRGIIDQLYFIKNEESLDAVRGSEFIDAIVAFIDGDFVLTDLVFLQELSGSKISDLLPSLARRIKERYVGIEAVASRRNKNLAMDYAKRFWRI